MSVGTPPQRTFSFDRKVYTSFASISLSSREISHDSKVAPFFGVLLSQLSSLRDRSRVRFGGATERSVVRPFIVVVMTKVLPLRTPLRRVSFLFCVERSSRTRISPSPSRL